MIEGQKRECAECREFEREQRERLMKLEEEVVKLRTALARLAHRAGISEHIPGAPARDAPFEVLVKFATEIDRGWNALAARLMDKVGGCEHCECPEAHERNRP